MTMYIAHRGNLEGRVAEHENDPAYLQEAITEGYVVEVDLWNIDVKKTTDIITEEATEADADNNDNDIDLDLIDPVNKWANIRNICDAHDIEMQSLLKGLRKQ